MTSARANLFVTVTLILGTAGAARAGRCVADYGPIEKKLNAARARWTTSGITAYNYRFSRTCLCDQREAGPFRARVENGAVRAAIYQGASAYGIPDGTRAAEADLSNVVPIDRLFNIIAGAIAKKACSIEVAYEAALGYPTKVDIDFDPDTADEELRFSISDLRPSSPPRGPSAPAR